MTVLATEKNKNVFFSILANFRNHIGLCIKLNSLSLGKLSQVSQNLIPATQDLTLQHVKCLEQARGCPRSRLPRLEGSKIYAG